jgi:hypothetical protein
VLGVQHLCPDLGVRQGRELGVGISVVPDDEAAHRHFVRLGGEGPDPLAGQEERSRHVLDRRVARIEGIASALAPASNVNATTRALVGIRVQGDQLPQAGNVRV